ncbi:MAG: hypothetical protein ABIK92_05725 [Pseudomonadota bacterium]
MKNYAQLGFETIVSLVYKASGLDVFGRFSWLQKSLAWTPKQRYDWRLKQLNTIIKFAWEHVPFYKEYWGDHGVSFQTLKSMEELQKYPILTKDIFRSNCRNIRPDNMQKIRHRAWHTGGTTGQPVHYLRDMEQWTIAEAFHLWGWTQMGYVFGDPIGVIAGGSLIPERGKLPAHIRGLMHRKLFLYGVAMDQSIASNYCNQLRKHGSKYLYGYPSILYLFVKHLSDLGMSLPGIKAVVTTAEMLQPQYRDKIESVLGCRVFNNLGCNDGGFESYECSRHDGFHYNDLQSVLEVDSEERSGKGKLLITNLWNRSTPFIRYENGDIVELRDQLCSCGCAFPLINSIQGRTADILTFANGRSLAGPALTLIFGTMEIDGWQIVQTDPDRLEVRICCQSEIKPDYINLIHTVLKRYLDDVQIIIKRVDKLETTKGGKWKPIWSEVEFEDVSTVKKEWARE